MSLNRVSPLRILIPVFAVIALIAVGFSVRSVLRYNEPHEIERRDPCRRAWMLVQMH